MNSYTVNIFAYIYTHTHTHTYTWISIRKFQKRKCLVPESDVFRCSRFYQIWSCFFLTFTLFIIYLAMLSLSYSIWDLWSLLWQAGSLAVACKLLVVAWDLVPWPEIKPEPPALGAQSVNHWTTVEVPSWNSLGCFQMLWPPEQIPNAASPAPCPHL